jgi:C1A family cysteine protease
MSPLPGLYRFVSTIYILASSGGRSMPVSLEEVVTAIGREGANWKADVTTASKYLSAPIEEANLFGLSIDDRQAEALLAEASAMQARSFRAAAPPPRQIDWRNHRGKNYVTPIKDQSTCGSCVAFATCACLESRVAIQRDRDNPQLDLSEAHLFFCGCGPCCRKGWNFKDALNWSKKPGIGLESAFPYRPQNLNCPKPQPSPVVDIPSWLAVTTVVARKQAIAEEGPVIAGMKVYEDFYYYSGGIYTYTTGVLRGLHAVCVVGYNDAQEGHKGYWIVKNSWGTGWGEKGFVRIAYGQCGIDTSYAFYDPEVSAAASLSV